MKIAPTNPTQHYTKSKFSQLIKRIFPTQSPVKSIVSCKQQIRTKMRIKLDQIHADLDKLDNLEMEPLDRAAHINLVLERSLIKLNQVENDLKQLKEIKSLCSIKK